MAPSLKGKRKKKSKSSPVGSRTGGTGAGVKSMPLPMLKGMRKKQKEREVAARDYARKSGSYVAPKAKKGAISQTDELKKRLGSRHGLEGVGDGSRGLRIQGVGTFSRGTLYISKTDIKKVAPNTHFEDEAPQAPQAQKKGRSPSWIRKANKKKKKTKRGRK